jgi:hypothetical protein
MDKLRVIWDYVGKYHFWLLCVVAVGASLAGWVMARGTLSAEYQKRKGTIQGKFGALDQIRQTDAPPNSTWRDEIAKLTEAERKEVASAWETVYAEQQKVLEWPQVLGEPFKRDVNAWVDRWITKKEQTAEMQETWRENYRNRVANVEFEKLLAIIDAEPRLSDSAKGGAAPAASGQPERQYRVNWNTESQQAVQKAMEIDSTLAIPSSFEVWLKLEDLWVYRAVLETIRATNEGSGYISRVKSIDALSIGVKAAEEFKKGMTSGGHIIYAEAPPQSSDGQANRPGRQDETDKPIDEGRYVDSNGDPLSGGVAHNEQFKRLPIYLRLVTDQREISRLLTACANSPLPVEVRQLRINPSSKDERKSGAPPVPSDGEAASPTTPGPFDVTVEIHGLIYIYNPPDPAKLGLPGADPRSGA